MTSRIPLPARSRLGRRSVALHGYFRIQLRLELLESRALLSASPSSVPGQVSPAWFDSPDNSSVEVGNRLQTPGEQPTQRIDWNGRTVEARTNEWVVQLTNASLAGTRSVSDAAGLFADSGLSVVRGLGLSGQLLVSAGGMSSAAAAKWLQSNPAIAFFEPNFVVSTAEFPNDDRFSQLWGL
ncbi:MAG: hypothetical protein HY000_13520, partial [Planctomycetes bacterium]|nr:hypothetical protein [Planctomycetota bacterium]